MNASLDRRLRETAAAARARRETGEREMRRRGLATLAVGVSFGAALLLALLGDWRIVEGRFQLLVVTGTACFMAVLVWAVAPAWRQNRFERASLVPLVLESLGDFDYEPAGRISEAVLTEARIFGRWSDYSGSDLVRGIHAGLPFGYARARLTRGGPAKLESLVTRGRMEEVFRGGILAVEGIVPAGPLAVAFTDRDCAMPWLADLLGREPALRRRNAGPVEAYSVEIADGTRLARLAGPMAALKAAAGADGVELVLSGSRAVVRVYAGNPFFSGMAPDPAEEARDFRREIAAALDLVAALAEA